MAGVPNAQDAIYTAQADLDDLDLLILAAAATGTGIISGLALDPTGPPSMQYTVSAGTVQRAGYLQYGVSAGSVTCAAADATNPRIDVVIVNGDTGAIDLIPGFPAAAPACPPIPISGSLRMIHIVLDAIYVPAGATSLAEGNLCGKYVLLPANRMPEGVTSRLPAADLTIPASGSLVVSQDYEIPVGVTVELAAGAVLEVI